MTLGAIEERSQLTIQSCFCRLSMCWSAWAHLLSGQSCKIHRDQTRTSLTVGLTLFIAVELSGLRPSFASLCFFQRLSLVCETLVQGWQKPVPAFKEMRLLDAGSGSERANCSSISLTSVYIGNVIPKCHNVNRFASTLALSSFELSAVEMSRAFSAM